jgi:hypothetical protein
MSTLSSIGAGIASFLGRTIGEVVIAIAIETTVDAYWPELLHRETVLSSTQMRRLRRKARRLVQAEPEDRHARRRRHRRHRR